MADTSGGGGSQAEKILIELQRILGLEPKAPTIDPDVEGDAYGNVWDSANQRWVDPYGADKQYHDAHTAWSQTFTAVDNLYKNLAGVEGRKDQHHADLLADFNARTTATHYANSDAQTKAQSDIDTFFKGQDESRARADLALKGQEDLIKWGTAPGKSSYSANDLGAAFANTMRQAGMDPSKGMLNYTGTTYLDPIGDMQRGDNLLGVSGKPPGSANLLTGETDPASSGYSPGATPPPPSLDGAIAGLRGPSGVGSSVKGGFGSVGGALQGAGAPLAVSGAPGNDDWRNNLLHGAGLTWDKAPALFKWG